MPSPRYGFRFEAVSQLGNLNLSVSVYLSSANFRRNLSFVPKILHGILEVEIWSDQQSYMVDCQLGLFSGYSVLTVIEFEVICIPYD